MTLCCIEAVSIFLHSRHTTIYHCELLAANARLSQRYPRIKIDLVPYNLCFGLGLERRALHDEYRHEDTLEDHRRHLGHCRQHPSLDRPHKRPKLALGTLMDPPPRDSRTSFPHASNLITHPPRTSSHGGAGEGNSRSGSRIGEALRRLHSDGEVSANSPGLHGGMGPEGMPVDGETWTDFFRHSPAVGQLTPEQIRIAKGRAALIAADRKRRLSEQQEDHSRRRSASNISIGQTANHRMRQSLTHATHEDPLITSSLGAEIQPGQRITERPLPRRPSFGSSRDRRSQENILPRWQPDNEVSACPICGTQFGLLYRRHHCRKCGRVVCASCSPHRITIPRQFIVRSPQEAAAMQRARTARGTEVVDLTGDSENNASPSHHAHGNGRLQSQDYRIDPALGGGQEVRLCNPCVPDPNPLPHLAYPSPNRHGLDPFARSGETPNRPSPGNFSASAQQGPPLARRTSSDRLDRRMTDVPTSSNNSGQQPGGSSFFSGPAIDRRHSHASRPPGRAPQPPPNYQSIFGSAPEPPLDDVRLHSCHTSKKMLIVDRTIFSHYSNDMGRHILATVITFPP